MASIILMNGCLYDRPGERRVQLVSEALSGVLSRLPASAEPDVHPLFIRTGTDWHPAPGGRAEDFITTDTSVIRMAAGRTELEICELAAQSFNCESENGNRFLNVSEPVINDGEGTILVVDVTTRRGITHTVEYLVRVEKGPDDQWDVVTVSVIGGI